MQGLSFFIYSNAICLAELFYGFFLAEHIPTFKHFYLLILNTINVLLGYLNSYFAYKNSINFYVLLSGYLTKFFSYFIY